MNPIRKAVFPVAGLGMSYLPATKSIPKEMLPVVDKPLIQYAVDEAVKAGITDLIFVTGRHKGALEDHFDRQPALELELAARQETELLDIVRNVIPNNVHCAYVRQPRPLGLGHAVLCAAPVIDNEPFAVLLADDLIDSEVSVIQQLIEVAHAFEGSVIGTQLVNQDDMHKYGIVIGNMITEPIMQVQGIVEKPNKEATTSHMAVVGRYVFEPEIIEYLRYTKAGVDGEIQLTDAIAEMLKTRSVFGHNIQGTRYDCGSKEGYFKANIKLAMKYHDLLID